MNDETITLLLPKQTHVGAGAVARAADAARGLGARSAFVVSDKAIAESGHLGHLVDILAPACERVTVFDGVEPEPTVACIDAVTAALRAAPGVDLIVSLGGGSVLDAAKCANVLALNGGVLADYEDGVDDPRPIERLLPQIAIPTTAGTGSEATIWAVFVDPARSLKNAISAPDLIADVAILDPALTITVPPAVTAGTGMDALTHGLEAGVSLYASPLTDALAERAIALVAGSLRAAVADGADLAARHDLLLGSYLAGIAFSNSSCGIVHSLSEAVGGAFRTPHGITNALLLAPCMEYNRSAVAERYAALAPLLGAVAGSPDAAADAVAGLAIDAVRRLVADIGLTGTLGDLGVERNVLPELLDLAVAWVNESGNPREADAAQVLAIYEAVC